LIDYNIAPENGVDVLRKLKRDGRFNSIPVVILSDNNLDKYSKAAYAAGASSFIKKPADMGGTRHKIETFFKYWFEVVEL
jgi:DNA-binding NarL/FixJ family response regulator